MQKKAKSKRPFKPTFLIHCRSSQRLSQGEKKKKKKEKKKNHGKSRTKKTRMNTQVSTSPMFFFSPHSFPFPFSRLCPFFGPTWIHCRPCPVPSQTTSICSSFNSIKHSTASLPSQTPALCDIDMDIVDIMSSPLVVVIGETRIKQKQIMKS